jgi:hypothetical protein
MGPFIFGSLRLGQRLLSPVTLDGILIGFKRLQAVSKDITFGPRGEPQVMAIHCTEAPKSYARMAWWNLNDLVPGDFPVVDMPEYGIWLDEARFA